MASIDKVREPAVAGMFYSGRKENLTREVAVFLENSNVIEDVEQVYGLVAPHAGYLYSGGVAARAYRQIVDREYDVVIVISPSHRVYFDEVSIFNGSAYSTPLGQVSVDKELAQEICACHEDLLYSDLGHDVDEHALEVHLPFLQIVLEEFKLVPIVMGNQDRDNITILSDALAKTLKDKNALIVASTDLSHYYNHTKASVLDEVVLENTRNYDDDKLYDDIQSGACEMCGSGPLITTMKACRALGATKSKVLLYRNSGDVTGDRNQVVGYMSGMFYK
ncbi:MAG: AmmeMemoRadiSam system protein B [Calditrichaceae bacterium]|jgi:AmmeMemoRadiSam system protein B